MNSDAVTQSQFVSLNGSTAPVLSRLSYVGSEPFAVTIALRAEHGRWVEWTFSRDLLVTGLSEPTGAGDVRIHPDLGADQDLLLIEIESPGGYALIEIEREDVEEFIASSAEIVPLGEESDNFDLDAFIDEITKV